VGKLALDSCVGPPGFETTRSLRRYADIPPSKARVIEVYARLFIRAHRSSAIRSHRLGSQTHVHCKSVTMQPVEHGSVAMRCCTRYKTARGEPGKILSSLCTVRQRIVCIRLPACVEL